MATFDIKRVEPLTRAQPRLDTDQVSPCGACAVRQLTFCAPLEGGELRLVAAIVSNVELQAGESLFNEADPADYVFNVTAGTVKVYKLLADGRRQVTGFLFAGDFVGLADSTVYAYSAEAVTPVVLCRFPRRKLEKLLEEHPKIEKRLLGIASNELAAAQEQMLLLGRKTAKEKIASFLLMLSDRAHRRGQAPNPVALPMSRNDIGDYLGLTTETVSRTFTQFKTSGSITLLPAGKVELKDRAYLTELAEGS